MHFNIFCVSKDEFNKNIYCNNNSNHVRFNILVNWEA